MKRGIPRMVYQGHTVMIIAGQMMEPVSPGLKLFVGFWRSRGCWADHTGAAQRKNDGSDAGDQSEPPNRDRDRDYAPERDSGRARDWEHDRERDRTRDRERERDRDNDWDWESYHRRRDRDAFEHLEADRERDRPRERDNRYHDHSDRCDNSGL